MIFTFDGDAAGQKAALRAFGGDQNFVSQTYVAVEPDGPRPVRPAASSRATPRCASWSPAGVPLYRFVLANVVEQVRPRPRRRPGRRRSARRRGWCRSIRDKSKVDAFARELAGMVGVDVERGARRGTPRGRARPGPRRPHARGRCAGQRRRAAPSPQRPPLPDLRDPRFALERETLKLVVQEPDGRRPHHRATSAPTTSPTRPTARVWELVEQRGGPGAADAGWAARLRDARRRPGRRRGARRRSPSSRCRAARAPDDAFVANTVYRLQELTAQRRIAEVKSRAPAHQPGRAHRRVQPDVRRADRPRAAPPPAARPGAGRPVRSVTSRPRAAGRGGAGRAAARLGAGRRRRRGSAGTRDALYLPGARGCRGRRSRPPTGTATSGPLRVSEVGTWGRAACRARAHPRRLARADTDRLLQLVRERVTASVLLSRHVPITRQARRPRGRPPRARRDARRCSWLYEYDEGIDPDDPVVAGGRRGRSGRRAGRRRARLTAPAHRAVPIRGARPPC